MLEENRKNNDANSEEQQKSEKSVDVAPEKSDVEEPSEKISEEKKDAFFDKKRPGAEAGEEWIERVVKIGRVSKVVKGGKNFSFNALVIAGDGKGRVGIGFGKSNEVVGAITKGTAEAKKSLKRIQMRGDTIPHEITGKFKATSVILKPAGPGTGVIAGGPVRALCDAAGIKNILTKSLGSRNPVNVVKATMDGFLRLRLKRRG